MFSTKLTFQCTLYYPASRISESLVYLSIGHWGLQEYGIDCAFMAVTMHRLGRLYMGFLQI